MKKSIGLLFSSCSLLASAQAQLFVFEFTGASTGDNQFNTVTTQPSHGTVSPFTRVNVNWNTGNNVFNSRAWNAGLSLDPTEYVGFSLAAEPGYGVSLSQVTFDVQRSSTGPLTAEVGLFLNGASTPAESLVYSPPTSLAAQTFDFSDVVGAALVEFRFYGYVAASSAGTLQFDDVTAEGIISSVPEPSLDGVVSGLILAGYGLMRPWLRRLALTA